MSKRFFEVFDSLSVSKALIESFANTDIERLSYAEGNTVLRVYLHADFLVPKNRIISMENAIYDQYYPESDIQRVHIIENFTLPEKYTLGQVIDEYKDSIVDDFIEDSRAQHAMLAASEWEIDGDRITITIRDSFLSRQNADSIAKRVSSILINRLGFSADVVVGFKNAPASKEPKKNIGAMPVEPAPAADLYQESPMQDAPEEYMHPIDIPADYGYEEEPEYEYEYVSVAPPAEPAMAEPAPEAKAVKKGKLKSGGKKTDPKAPEELPEGYLFGKKFDENEFTPIQDLVMDLGTVVIRGRLGEPDIRETRKKKDFFIFTVPITDFTDTIMVKFFLDLERKNILEKNISKGMFVEIKGKCQYDDYNKEFAITNVFGIRKGADFRTKRMDNAPEKRVELHLHTKSSEMDAVSNLEDVINTVRAWGHKAVAITDHGVVHAFADASHLIKASDKSLKILYGCEGYLVDDELNTVERANDLKLAEQTYVAFDIETTGFSPEKDHVIEIGAVKIKNGEIIDRFSSFVCPPIAIPYRIEELTGINDAMVADAPVIDEVLPKFLRFCEGCIMVAHNAKFDMGFMTEKASRMGIVFEPPFIDTVGFARALLLNLHRFTLDSVAKDLKIVLEHHHRAVDDAECCGWIFIKLMDRVASENLVTLNDLNARCVITPETVKKLRTSHVTIIATNTIGRFNLYRLVSMAHLNYFSRFPRIPKSVLSKYREGLLVGSACSAGQVMDAIIDGRSQKEVINIARYYDFLEIMPAGNDAYLLKDEKHDIRTVEDLQELSRKVVEIGKILKKPVVATGDSHFLNPEDEIYRRIIQSGKDMKDADEQPPLYLRTTEEMLDEFSYLGAEKAYEVVVKNTNLIADMCDFITPVRPDKCPPVIPNSDKTLRDICYSTAKAQYGDPLPEIVQKRLDHELNSIISNGYAVMYIIAQKLVNKSNEDGYLVGSRGSVGSSLAATMSGITEVNPLSPHYYCKKCKFSDFDSEEVRAFAGGAGCDMPDRNCPVCGEPLIKDGFDIPFETFLGFKGDKEPDIDLNFSGEYQSKAHAYTEVIFGAGQTFRAGTIASLADKTAFGYVKKYFEKHGETKRTAEVLRLAEGCTGIRQSTGQHPGGIIVLPLGEDINTFTPVQHPANDTQTATVTTHFDYHSIDHNLLKLDILGHDDPTMIRMINDLTGIDPRTFPLDSPEVMSLFKDTSALGITPDQLTNCRLGCLGIPEFGTDFAMQMVIDCKPQHFSDLVRISGLSHGTDVWLNNAQVLIQEGKATISTAVCTRDDIMVYLINKGVESGLAFNIMERVRKGVVAKGKCKEWPEWKEEMISHGVPGWYIWSCEKIKYMFPKAHAAAYVMMAWRIAYAKIFYPLAYYASYFSIRSKGFSYELMCMGHEKLNHAVRDYYNRKDELSAHEEEVLKDMRIVQEMFARGYDFMPIDLYRAKAQRFQIIDGKIMPSFLSIEGMGGKAAENMELAALDGPYVSREDIKERTKISQTVLDKLGALGLLGDLPVSNQFSLADLGLI